MVRGDDRIIRGNNENYNYRGQAIGTLPFQAPGRLKPRPYGNSGIETSVKNFLSKISRDKVKEVGIDMKECIRKLVEALYPEAKAVADTFHVIADPNRRMDEARRREQDIHRKARANTELLWSPHATSE